MTDVRVNVTTAITAVHARSWLNELPPDTALPAIVFTVDSTSEDQWCHEGGYDQHTVTVVLLARDADWFSTMHPLITAAMEGLGAYFMFEDSSGDGEYEEDPSVQAFFVIYRLRTPRY